MVIISRETKPEGVLWDPEGQGNNQIQGDQHKTFHIVGFPILEKKVDKKHRDEKDDSLEIVKEEGEFVPRAPTNHHEEWHDEGGDLDRTAHADANSKLHFVLHSHPHRGDVFGCICDNGEKDETDECLWYIVPFCSLLNRRDQPVRDKRRGNSNNQKAADLCWANNHDEQ